MSDKKIAVVFPGVGYHAEKPLLYYSRKIAEQYGYEIVCADYGTLPSGIKGDTKKMYEAYERAIGHVTEQLSPIDFSAYGKVLFLSKSIGTAVAASYDACHKIGAGHVYYTPVEASFQAIGREGIVFHGTGDDWADTCAIQEACKKRNLPLFLTENANHAMEVGDVLKDLEHLRIMMEHTERYIQKFTYSERTEDV